LKASWNFQELQEIPNPAPNSGAKDKHVNLKPAEWIAANYPYKDKQGGDFMNEFKLLQKAINSPAKNNVSRVRTQPTDLRLLTFAFEDVCSYGAPDLRRRRYEEVHHAKDA
jgi:hypothetical protein